MYTTVENLVNILETLEIPYEVSGLQTGFDWDDDGKRFPTYDDYFKLIGFTLPSDKHVYYWYKFSDDGYFQFHNRYNMNTGTTLRSYKTEWRLRDKLTQMLDKVTK